MKSEVRLFKQLPETNDQEKKYISVIRNAVMDGEVDDPLKFYARVARLERLFKKLKDDYQIKDVVLDEAQFYGEKVFDHGEAQFQVKEVGVRFDFDNCEDSEYTQIKEDMAVLNAKKKEREKFLKSITPEMEVFGSDGLQLKPAVKSSTTQVVVKLK